MKTKLLSFILITLGVILFAGKSFAAGVEITGTAFNDEMGVIHFDYTTAENPDPADPTYDASSFYVGPTKQFYIDPYAYSNDYNGPGDPLVTAMISTEDADCGPAGCLLKGFIWSDTIGWISLDGEIINTSLATPPGDENTINDPYPSYMWPMAKVVPANPSNNKYGLTGYIWNEYTGWIRLSSDDAGVTGVTTDVGSQALGDWGVYLDADEAIEQGTDQNGITVDKGRPLRGYAWSENLGWIKFTKETGDAFAFDFGVFTTWLPDDTPAIPLTPDKVWFAVGVNTSGSGTPPADPTTIIWDDFAADPQSGISATKTQIHFDLADPVAFANCNKPADSAIVKTTKALPPTYPVPGTGNTLTLTLPVLGNIKTPPMVYGYCRYEVHAKIVNGNNDAIYMGDPTYFGDPAAPIDNITYFDKSTVFVRAGDVDTTTTTIVWDPPDASSGSALADGEDFVKYEIDMVDLAGNPIMDVDCLDPVFGTLIYAECPTRAVNLTAGVTNDMRFDMTQPRTNPYTPIKHSDTNVDTIGDWLTDNDTDPLVAVYNGSNDWDIRIHRTNYTYSLELASFAPGNTSNTIYNASTETYSDTTDFHFYVNDFNAVIDNDELPHTAQWVTALGPPPTLAPKPGTDTAAYIDTDVLDQSLVACTGNPSVSCPVFAPPINTSNPVLVAGGLQNVLSLAVPADLEFTVNNMSSKSIDPAGAGPDEGGVSIDNIFQYYSSGFGGSLAAIMETHSIKNMSSDDPNDTDMAWTNPFDTCADCTRYEMYQKNGDYFSGQSFSSVNSPFHAFFSQFHPTSKFYFNSDILEPAKDILYADIKEDFRLAQGLPDTADEIDSEGIYYISGLQDIPLEHDPLVDEDSGGDLTDPYNYPPGKIDRSDEVSLKLASSVNKKIQFVPQKFVTSTIKDIRFRLVQEISYRFAGQPFPTVYGQTPLLEDIDVKDIGIEAEGTVAAEKIVTGRQFETVGTAGARQLQEQIRKNVARLIAGLDTTNCKLTNGATETIATFPLTGDCVVTDNVNNTKFIYYEGDTSNEIVLDGPATGIQLPSMPYTLIVKGGANIFIKDNLYYPTGAGVTPSFGIINIAETVGQGANTYIAPEPTNIAAVLYTEGSILSRSTAGDLYYGGATGNVQDLDNQLYWVGSIASRNTIAGAGQEKVPTGITCLAGDTKQACAQRYDLDYLRRFTVSIDPVGPPPSSNIANNGMFSGGGTCPGGTCSCATCAPGGNLPTTVVLSGGQIVESSSELAPVYVKKDPGTLNNPPPGFSVTIGLETMQEIR